MTKRAIVHIEIPAADRVAAAKFYEAVFGWESEHMSEPMPYTMIHTGEEKFGVGMPDIGEMYKAGDVILYVESGDVAADLKAIEQAGGKRLSDPFKVGDFGEMAMFVDPSGNKLALWKSLTPAGGAE